MLRKWRLRGTRASEKSEEGRNLKEPLGLLPLNVGAAPAGFLGKRVVE